MRRILIGLALLLPLPALAQSISVLTATASSPYTPATVQLTWSATGCATLTASGAWSGTKALSGTQTVTGVVGVSNYQLTCTGPSTPGSTAVAWVPPTLNTDGSPLTNLAGFKIVYGSSPTTMTQSMSVMAPTATSYTLTGLANGLTYFAVRAVTTNNAIESVDSNIASKTIVSTPGAVVTKAASVTLDTRPNPPTGVTVGVVSGMDHTPAFRILASGARSAAGAGYVPVGRDCFGAVVFSYRGKDYRRVNPSDVKWWNTTATAEVAAPCIPQVPG